MAKHENEAGKKNKKSILHQLKGGEEMNKIEIRVDPNTGLTSSVKLGGVEIGQSVRSVTFHHEGGNWPTLTLELVSNDVLLDIPNATEDVGASKGISV